MEPPWGNRAFMIGLIFCFLGCASAGMNKPIEDTDLSHDQITEPIAPPRIIQLSRDQEVELPAPPETEKMEFVETGEPPLSPAVETNHQSTLDSALEYCQTSNELWERGDLEGAIDALDTAYSLILEVDADDDAELIQQKEDLRFTISKRIIEAYASRATSAQGPYKAIPLVMNNHVEKAIESFAGREREFLLASYRRSGRYRTAIVEALKEAGLPEELSWLPLIESGFKVRALSRARALGLWQFIASTGYKFGLERDSWIDERMDPEKSTRAAIAYLKELHQMFGDWTTALAAYNCGEWAVLKRIRQQRVNYLDDFWDLYEHLPRETASYVPRFLAVLHILKDPGAYGLELPPPEEPVELEQVTINKQVYLKTVADRLGLDYETMRDLNPELRHDSTPNSAYALKVPKGKGEVLLAKIDEIPAWRPPVPSYYVHRVRSGDTLSGLASRYRTSVRAIMTENGLRKSSYLKVGWKLKIPTRHAIATARARPLQPTALPGGQVGTYIVARGDSLWKIAGQHGTTTHAIRSLNGLRNSRLKVGQVLKVPKGTRESSFRQETVYRVKKGDSPYLVAQRYRMNLADFLRINNLTPASTIYPGQTLVVRMN